MTDTFKVQIISDALGHLGQEPVSDLSDAQLDQSVAAVKLLRSIDASRDTVLCRHGWLCALEYKSLTPVTDPGNWRYPTRFDLPGDALRVWEIEGVLEDAWSPRWQVATAESATSARLVVRAAAADGLGGGVSQLNVAYVRRANWAALTPPLRDAIAYDLAARQAYSITGDKGLSDRLRNIAEAKAVAAIGAEAQQEGGQPPLVPDIPANLRALGRGGGAAMAYGWDRFPI